MRISDWSSDVCSSDLARRTAEMSVALPPCLVRVEARIALAPGRQLRLVERQFLGVDVEHAAVAAAFAAVERERLFRRAWRKVGKHGCHALGGWAQSGSEEHTSELQSLMRHSYAVLCLK